MTDNKDIPESARELILLSHLSHLKYTQSNSVCLCNAAVRLSVSVQVSSQEYTAQDWQETRLTSGGSDSHPKVMGLQFVDNIRRPDRDNAIDVYIV